MNIPQDNARHHAENVRLGVIPKAYGVGGMVSFQAKLELELARRGIQVTYDLVHDTCEAVLVVGGTRHLDLLRRVSRQGVPIFQRLDGINWIHRVRKTGIRHFIRAELANWLLARIRDRLAQGIIYQSQFVVEWWERRYGPTKTPYRVVHNGVDLTLYSPAGEHQRPVDQIRVLMVEGSLGGGYELGLEHGIKFCERLTEKMTLPVELMIVGKASEATRQQASTRTSVPLRWAGMVPREQIPRIDRSAHMLFAADLQPACPNAVIEALACGLPVVGFDTGALKELVVEGVGQIVAYGGDPWKLDSPDFDALAEASLDVIHDQQGYRGRARAHAESVLALERMTDGYLEAMGLGKPG